MAVFSLMFPPNHRSGFGGEALGVDFVGGMTPLAQNLLLALMRAIVPISTLMKTRNRPRQGRM